MERFSLTFAHSLPLWLIALIAIGAICAVGILYLRAIRACGGASGAILFALKACAVAMLLFYIFRPVFGYERTAEAEPTIVLMIDSSKSMSIADTAGFKERIEEALALCADDGEMMKGLKKHFRIVPIRFSERSEALSEDALKKGFQADGEPTDFEASIRQALTSSGRNEKIRAIVLLTDGIETRGKILSDYRVPVPVYAVGIGSGAESSALVDDIAVTKISAPESAIVNNQVAVRATVSIKGFASKRNVALKIAVKRGSETAAETTATAGTRDSIDVELPFMAREIGIFQYEVSASEFEEEVIKENNRRSFTLNVTNPKIKLLYLSGSLNWDYKFLRSEFALDPNLEIVSLVRTAPGTYVFQGDAGGVDFSKGLPDDIDALSTFDIVILADVEPAIFTGKQLENLESYVGERGKSLLLLGGRNYMTAKATFAGTALEKALPIYFDKDGNRYRKEDFLLELTPAGKTHPIFEGTADYFDANSSYGRKRVTILSGYTEFTKAKPGAEILARLARDKEGDAVICAVQSYGKGRSMVFASDATWNWRFVQKAAGGETLYVKFWGQTARHLAGRGAMVFDPTSALNIWTDKAEYMEGDEAVVNARVFDADGRFDNSAKVSAVVVGGTNESRVEMPCVEGSRGEYRGRLPLDSAGRYKAVVTAVLGAGTQHIKECEFQARSRYSEFETTATDVDFLKALTANAGGRYYNVLTAGRIGEDIRSTLADEYERVERRAWDSWPFLLVLIGLLAAEWAYRRRKNLL